MFKLSIKRISVAATLFLSMHVLPSVAQDASNTIGRVTISSPTAAALGKYGDIPVSNHTGIPNISVPVYTIKTGKLELPVDLSYHASGLKVQEQASWVGAGWSLNAGGMITRTVRGAADDRGNNNGYVTHGYYSDSGYFNYSFHPDGSVPLAAQTNGLSPDDEQFVASRKDGEPDIYTFNFGGYNGKFYFNDDQSPVLVPEADFKIETDFAAGPGFRGFIITTSDGTKYYFGKTGNNNTAVDPVEITYSITTQNSYGLASRTASSWFLNKIVAFDKTDSIALNYQQENYSYYTTAMFPLYYGGFVQTGNTGFNAYPYEYDLVKNFTQGVRLSSITYPNGTVSFNAATTPRTDLAGFTDQTLTDAPNTEAKALSSIQIANSGTACKKMNFYYSYFYDNQNGLNGGLFTNNYPVLQNIHSDAYRLKLDSVQEVSCDNSLKLPAYKFDYFSEPVPRKLSFGIDHWGFYNGVTGNTTLIPANKMFTDQTFVEYPGANRDAAWPAMRGGTLNRITYPTGGFTQLDFEPHTTYTSFTQYVSTNVFNVSAGYDGHNGYLGDGGGNPANYSFTFTGNPYKITVSNTNNGIAGSTATLQVKDVNGTAIVNVVANPGETKTSNFKITPGTYTVFIQKQSATSGYGATAFINEQLPTLSSGNAIVGGLRIKTITSNDGVTNVNNIKSYSYNISNNASGNSSGILYSRPTYVQVVRNDIWGLIWGGAPALSPYGCSGLVYSGTEIHNSYKSPSSIRPMETTQGNHIGYNEVYVSQTNNGYSVYRYYGSNIWDNVTADVCKREFVNSTVCDPTIPNYPAVPLPFEYMRGELKYEGHFNQGNQILKDAWYYPEYVKNPRPTPGHVVFSSPDLKSFADYSLYTYRKTKSTTITTDYSTASGSLANTSITYYGSSYHNQPTRNVTFTSAADSIVTNMKYAADFRIATCDAQPDSLTYYLNRINNDNSRFSNTAATCTPQNVGDYSNCRYAAMIKLRYDLMLSRRIYMNFLKRTYSNANSVFNTCHLNAKTAAGTELKPILEMQDTYQNPAIETSKWRNSKLLSASFSRYDYGTVPAGKVYLNKVQAINLAATSTTFTTAAVSGNTIAKDSRYKDETFVKFYNGNLAEITSKDAVTTAYLWGYNNTLPIAKAIGTNQTTLLNAYNAVGGTVANLPLLRSQFPANTVQLNTYAYTPIVGMTSETDVNGKTINYEYDALWRLLLARDFNNNILKQYDYRYKLLPPDGVPQWTATGLTRCKPCSQNSIYITNILQQEEKDNNPASGSYNTVRWNDIGTSTSCVSNADWQNTSTALRCRIGRFGAYTGEQEQEQLDMNPCSTTYGQTQWVVAATNTSICPIPISTCNTTNCTGVDKKCINKVCEKGVRVNTSTVQNPDKLGGWTCTYHYLWSDGSISVDYTEVNALPCIVLDF
jgi:hypothetical protein